MEVSKQIEVFRGFFEKECLPEIMAAFQAGIPFITIDFNALSEADLELSELLLEGPDEIIKAAEIAMEHFDIPKSINSFKVRFIHLPKGSSKNVWEVRQDDIGKFIALKGVISKFSEVIHTCISARFECINCGKTVGMLMTDGKYKEPRKCSCGGKRFRRIQMQIEDVLKIGITDDLMEEDNKSRTVARTKIAILGGSLSSRELESLIATGRKVIMNGYFIYRQKSATVEFESVFVVNSMEFVEVGWQSVNILPHETKQIDQLAKQPDIIARLAESVADIKGYDEVKKACLLQLAGAPHIYDRNGVLASRGTMHILLIGNPSTGKTYIAKRFSRISPIY
ncbi:hypothetical protein KKE60_05935, partial [Patescibacteria group bacterium]|nr:hypothetical protein [Patescibacteria group bacterium]